MLASTIFHFFILPEHKNSKLFPSVLKRDSDFATLHRNGVSLASSCKDVARRISTLRPRRISATRQSPSLPGSVFTHTAIPCKQKSRQRNHHPALRPPLLNVMYLMFAFFVSNFWGTQHSKGGKLFSILASFTSKPYYLLPKTAPATSGAWSPKKK